jgi:hypothetical protein
MGCSLDPLSPPTWFNPVDLPVCVWLVVVDGITWFVNLVFSAITGLITGLFNAVAGAVNFVVGAIQGLVLGLYAAAEAALAGFGVWTPVVYAVVVAAFLLLAVLIVIVLKFVGERLIERG